MPNNTSKKKCGIDDDRKPPARRSSRRPPKRTLEQPPEPPRKVAKQARAADAKPPPPPSLAATRIGLSQELIWIPRDRLPPPHNTNSYFSPTWHFTQPQGPRLAPERSNRTSVRMPANIITKYSQCWNHKFAATACLNRREFPFGLYRLMGTITRTVQLRPEDNKRRPSKVQKYERRPERKPATIELNTAMKLARQEWEDTCTSTTDAPPSLELRAREIIRDWDMLLQSNTTRGECPWNHTGVIPCEDDRGYMDPTILRHRLVDNEHTDLTEILQACNDIQDPRHLWKIPLLQVYPVVTTTAENEHSVHMAVYMHRLLPEMNSTSLRCILQALDEGSYLCPRPHAIIPQCPVFASNPLPEVVTNEDDVEALDEQEEQVDGRSKTDDTAVAQKISAFSTEGLLKLLEHTGTDLTDYQRHYAPRLEQLLHLQLLPYQEHGIAWMIQMEALESINDLLWDEREFWDGGKYYCCPALGQVRLERPARLKGGLLCDRMGLGKTIEVVGLILATLPEMKEQAAETGGYHATLIIVPPALVAQWIAELRKCVGDDILTVDYYDFRTSSVARRLGKDPNADADIMITTYNALEKQATAKKLQDEKWARIVLDEMQEIRSSTTKIAKMCEKLSGDRRWMLSGTPLFDGIYDLRGELNFLKLCPFAASTEDGFFQFMIGDPWDNREIDAIERLQVLSTILLRRSKAMSVVATGRLLLDNLPPLTVEFVPVQPNDAERAINYYMEWIAGSETAAVADSKRYTQKRLCLRMLREFCISPILLNGGMGAGSQLKILNTLLISQARRQGHDTTTAQEKTGELRDLSCDEAILHLAEIQEAARCGGQVAEISLGYGQGLSRRVRAMDVDKLEQLEQTQAEAKQALAVARRARARLRWHLALEKITTGQARLLPSSEIRSFWLLRSAISHNNDAAPAVLRRGWRPSKRFFQSLQFPWAKQDTLRLEGIPLKITMGSVAFAVDRVVSSGSASSCFELVKSNKDDTTWSAYILFSDASAATKTMNQAQTAKGILLESNPKSSAVIALKSKAQEAYDRAVQVASVRIGTSSIDRAHLGVFPFQQLQPSSTNAELRKAAKRALTLAKSGVYMSKLGGNGHVTIAACDPTRSLENQNNFGIVHLETVIERHTNSILAASQQLERCTSRVSRLNKSVHGMSAVESLQALSDGDDVNTSCCICLDVLGSTGDDPVQAANISLTKCGHLYCRKCLRDCVNQNGFRNKTCPACRKPLSYGEDVVHVNPTLRVKENTGEEHKGIVERALELLSQEHGILPPDMWYHLFKSIEVPSVVTRNRHTQFTAIPGDFFAHLRAIFGDKLSPRKSFVPKGLTRESSWLSSKVKALLHDLPTDERSLVFATARSTIEHLSSVLTGLDIGHRILCTGQKVDDTERAIVDWRSKGGDGLIEVPVLLVQSGAAASGVTLTAACKMFLMEPFPRYSEEQQAFGRCHRIGQAYPVHAKVYYTPVSVESRLLDWRKKASKSDKGGRGDTKVVFATVHDSEDEDDPEDYVLGVHQHDVENRTQSQNQISTPSKPTTRSVCQPPVGSL